MQFTLLSKNSEQNYSWMLLTEILEMIAYLTNSYQHRELLDSTFLSENSSNITL